MPIKIEGVTYYSVTDIHGELRIARQTLWSWRKARNIPQGLRYRGRQIVFTKQDVEAIRGYANRLEPAARIDANKLKRFKSSPRKRSV